MATQTSTTNFAETAARKQVSASRNTTSSGSMRLQRYNGRRKLETFGDVQGAISERIARRRMTPETVDTIDQELIQPTSLSDDQKAALWLYAWSHLSRRRQIAEVRTYLKQLA